jgi:hypothetical protein
VFDTLFRVGTWHDPDLGRPIAAPLERCAELLGVDLAIVCELAAKVEPYVCADGTRIWSLMQLERRLRPEAGDGAATWTADRPARRCIANPAYPAPLGCESFSRRSPRYAPGRNAW